MRFLKDQNQSELSLKKKKLKKKIALMINNDTNSVRGTNS